MNITSIDEIAAMAETDRKGAIEAAKAAAAAPGFVKALEIGMEEFFRIALRCSPKSRYRTFSEWYVHVKERFGEEGVVLFATWLDFDKKNLAKVKVGKWRPKEKTVTATMPPGHGRDKNFRPAPKTPRLSLSEGSDDDWGYAFTDNKAGNTTVIRSVSSVEDGRVVNRVVITVDGDDIISTKPLGPLSSFGLYNTFGQVCGIHRVNDVGRNGDTVLLQVKDAETDELIDYVTTRPGSDGKYLVESLGLVSLAEARKAAGIEIKCPEAPNAGKKTNVGNPRGKGSSGGSKEITSNPEKAARRAKKLANKK